MDETRIAAIIFSRDLVQLAERLFMLRREYFWWKCLDPGWRACYTKGRPMYPSFYDINAMMRWLPVYREAIPTCAANTIQRAHDAWRAWRESTRTFNACKAPWHAKVALKGDAREPCPGCGYTGKPGMPRYAKKGQRSAIYFTYTQFSIKNHHAIFPRKSGIAPIHVPRLMDQAINDARAPVKQTRIIPAESDGFWVEFIHDVDVIEHAVNEQNVMGIDLGMNAIATIVNNLGDQPICFSGQCKGGAKEINQWYSKEMARLQADRNRSNPRIAELQRKHPNLSRDEWTEWHGLMASTRHMAIVTGKRNRRVGKLFHVISKHIIDLAVARNIGKIIIGHNPFQKQGLDRGKRFNQEFGQLPIFRLVSMIKYKAALNGITLVEIAEAFTSKASFLDDDPVPDRQVMVKKPDGHSDMTFSGKRVARGLYVSKHGIHIHADVNAACNIVRKACPDAFTRHDMPVKLYPRRINVNINDNSKKSPDIFGWNGAGVRHHPDRVIYPHQSGSN
nr:transposase [Candidatus Sigynarchaeota archaeon]